MKSHRWTRNVMKRLSKSYSDIELEMEERFN